MGLLIGLGSECQECPLLVFGSLAAHLGELGVKPPLRLFVSKFRVICVSVLLCPLVGLYVAFTFLNKVIDMKEFCG